LVYRYFYSGSAVNSTLRPLFLCCGLFL